MAEADQSRQLSVEQENAIDLLIQGKTDRETAHAVGVSRQTVTGWRNHDAEFIAELHRRRREIWGVGEERLRNLVSHAVDVLAQNLKSRNARLRHAAAVDVLRASGLYGSSLCPTGSIDPREIDHTQRRSVFEREELERDLKRREMFNKLDPLV